MDVMESQECIQRFKIDYSRRFSEVTLYAHELAVNQLLSYCAKPYTDIDKKDIKNWMVHMNDKGLKTSSVNKMLYLIKSFFKYCVDENLIATNPVASISIPSQEEWLPKCLEPEQLAQLRKLVLGNIREQAIIELLFATGIRVSELLALKEEDVVWSERLIYIREGKCKKGRIVLFTQLCGEYLKAYLDKRNDDSPYLIINKERGKGKMSKMGIQRLFKKYSEELGFRITAHMMRHTFAAYLIKRGMRLECIQVLLGHVAPSETHQYARLYAHAQKNMYDEWM